MTKKPPSRGDRGSIPLVELLEFAIAQTNDGIAIMKFTGDAEVPVRIVYANDMIERLSGYTREELLDPTNPFLRVQPQNRAAYDGYFREVRAGNPVRFEIELGGKDRLTWTEARWSPLRRDGGTVTHYVAVLRDISARRRAQTERELLYGAIEQAQAGICIVEVPEGDARRRRPEYVNDALCKLFKISRDEITAERLARLLFAEKPGLLEEYIAKVSRGGTFEHELRVTLDDGTSRWIHLTASPFYTEGRADKWLVFFRDIEEHKRDGEQLALFESILSQTSDFILICDATRPSQGGPQVTYANSPFAALVGLDPATVVSRTLLSFFSPRNDANTSASVISRLERHQSISHELLLRHPDGHDVWIELTGHHVRGEHGRPVSWFFIGKDISMRKQSYVQTAQLMTALDLAEEPIAIYRVIQPLELELEHMNERATALDRPLIEQLLLDPVQRAWIKNAWPALEDGRSINRLVRTGASESSRWVRLEIRPMRLGNEALGSIIAIEHGLLASAHEGRADDIGAALALSQEILGYAQPGERREAFLEVLRQAWGVEASFSRTNRASDLVLRVKDRNGFAIIPHGVLFDQAVAVDFAWSQTLQPHRLTALRIFMETIARAD
jgi:PAS domain S-box-containing protein